MYYDSDEVRNAVGHEIWTAVLRDGVAPDSLSSWELDALGVSAERIIRSIRETIENAVRALVNAFHEWAKHIAQVFASVTQATREAFCELVDLLGLPDDGFGLPQAAWPRKPVIILVCIIDAVAAGRHPAMMFRARRVGGRR